MLPGLSEDYARGLGTSGMHTSQPRTVGATNLPQFYTLEKLSLDLRQQTVVNRDWASWWSNTLLCGLSEDRWKSLGPAGIDTSQPRTVGATIPS